mmetsp:Transcript_95113/g.254178  ORF Transcript_95113/g.254178 Transcript_95113/m.254178 type:complete len:336 (+) Transcript_95113:2-1009(+)
MSPQAEMGIAVESKIIADAPVEEHTVDAEVAIPSSPQWEDGRASAAGSVIEAAIDGVTVKKGQLNVYRQSRLGAVGRSQWQQAEVIVTAREVFAKQASGSRWKRLDVTGLALQEQGPSRTPRGVFYKWALARPGGEAVVKLSCAAEEDYREWIQAFAALIEKTEAGEQVGAAGAVVRWRYDDINPVGKVSPWRYSKWAPVVAAQHDLEGATEQRPITVDISVDGSRETKWFPGKQDALVHLRGFAASFAEVPQPEQSTSASEGEPSPEMKPAPAKEVHFASPVARPAAPPLVKQQPPATSAVVARSEAPPPGYSRALGAVFVAVALVILRRLWRR